MDGTAEATSSTPPSFYDKYIRPRYHSDPAFRQKLIARAAAFNASVKDEPSVRARKREAARQYYHSHPEYRARKNRTGRHDSPSAGSIVPVRQGVDPVGADPSLGVQRRQRHPVLPDGVQAVAE